MKSCDDCHHASVCRLLEGERNLRFFGVDTKEPHATVQKLKQELASRCRFFSGG